MNIGKNIKRYRKEKGLTQKQLGEMCNMADSAIRRYENGGANPKQETLQKIAYALGITVDNLKYGELNTTGKLIQYYRAQQRLTQEELSNKTSIPLETLKSYENDSVFPTDNHFCRLCENLYVFPDELKEVPGFKHYLTKDGVSVTAVVNNTPPPEELLKHYSQLNDKGKEEAVKRVSELTQIPKYQKDKE